MELKIRNVSNKNVAVLDAIAKDRNVSRSELVAGILENYVFTATSSPNHDILAEVVADNTVALKAIVNFLKEREEMYNELAELLSKESLKE